MGLFGRRRDKAAAPMDTEPEQPALPEHGPWDVQAKPDLDGRVDLGALRIPPRPGMQLRVELDRTSRQPMAVTLVLGKSSAQLQLFAAPRSASLWDDVRPDLANSVTDKSGVCDDVPGVFGRELLVKLPVTTKGGSGLRPVRFVGIDGPRWMLRVVFHGEAALNAQAATELEGVVRDVVVVRGMEPRPPREVIALTLPGQNAPKAEEDDPLQVLRRGPEMTETR